MFFTKKQLQQDYKEYLKLIDKNEKPYKSKNIVYPETLQLRRLNLIPPIYILLDNFQEVNQEKLYKCYILTEEITLGALCFETLTLTLHGLKTILVVLPLWVYFLESFITDYSEFILYITQEDLNKIEKYVKQTSYDRRTIQGKYIEKVAKRLAKYNTNSILQFLDLLEEDNNYVE